jgi:hypothetical protein
MLTSSSESYNPVVKIQPDKTVFKFQVEIHIMNPFDSSIDAIVMKCVISSYLSFSIGSSDFKLYAEADEIDMEFTEIDSYYKTHLNKNRLNDRISFIKPFAVGYINKMLMDGFAIPIPPDIKKNIKNPDIR